MNENKINKLKALLEVANQDLVTREEVVKLFAELLKFVKDLKVSNEGKYSTVEQELVRLISDHKSLSKSADYSVDYFKKEINTLKNVISNLKLQHGKDGKDAEEVDTTELALEASKMAVEAVKPLIPTIPTPDTGEAIIGKINDDETTLIKKEKVEGLDELERKADFALSRPLMMGGGGTVLDIKGGTNTTVTKTGGIYTINATGSGTGGQVNTVVAGTGISVNSTDPVNPIVTNSAPDQVVSITGAGTSTVTGTYPNFTVTSTGGAGGGDVVGPATNTDSYIPQWDGANSKTLKNGVAVPAGGLAGLTEVGTKMNKFTVTALKTSNYTANVDEYVPCDISSSSFTITLPTAPADKTQIEILIVKTAADRVLTIQAGGTDKFDRTDGPQTIYMYLAIESLVCTYQSSTGIWFLQSAAAPFNFATGFPGIDAMTPITEADISIDISTRVLTINPSRGYFDFFVDGGGKITRLRKNGAVTFPAFTDTSGTWFFYFNSSGTAVTTQTPWTTNDFSNIASVYRIIWNKDLFSFTVTAATATAGDTYTNNSSTFTVQESISGGTTLICKRTTGTNNPSASGNLTRATGAGTDPIVFSAFSESPKLVDQIVEYHQNTISAEDHEWKHLYGTIYESGFTMANNAITSGAPNADGRNSVIALSTGENIDDNLCYTVTNSTGGAAWQQDMGNTTPASLNATNSALFKIFTQDSNSRVYYLPATRFPFAWNPTTNIPQFITATGVRTSVTSTNFFVYFVYATQNPITGEAIRTVSATSQFTNITNARAYVWADIQNSYSILANDPEIRPLYRLIFEHRTSYDDGAKNAVLRETQDIRKAAVTSTTTATGSLPATSVTVTPAGTISSTNVQSAIEELDTEKIPYTGATGAVTLGANTLSTTSGLISPKLYPAADSTTAVQINKADGTTNVLNVDTTNGRVGIGTAAPVSTLHVSGASTYNSDTVKAFRVSQAASTVKGVDIGFDATLVRGFIQAGDFGTEYKDLLLNAAGGNVGIGTTSPTAVLHLKAGTATASTAPLKFTSGTVNTTAESGALEWDGTDLFISI